MFNKKQPPQNELHGLSWESDIIFLERRSGIRAWRLVYALLVIVCLMSAALAGLLPLKTISPPIVLSHDKVTNEVTVATTSLEFARSSELNDKHWASKFVVARERYSYRFVQHDYDTVRAMASDLVFKSFEAKYDGQNALDKKYGENVQIIPKVISRSISNGNLATVRFETEENDSRAGGGEKKIKRWVALVKFEYKAQIGKKESEIVELNPLGFNVLGYQVDPELIETVGVPK